MARSIGIAFWRVFFATKDAKAAVGKGRVIAIGAVVAVLRLTFESFVFVEESAGIEPFLADMRARGIRVDRWEARGFEIYRPDPRSCLKCRRSGRRGPVD